KERGGAKPERRRGMVRRHRDRGKAAAEDLDRKRGAVDRQRRHSGGEGVDRHPISGQNEKQNLEDDEQRDVADDLNIDGGNSAREAVIGNPHQRADEAERKAQGEASALISSVRKAPQPSAGK